MSDEELPGFSPNASDVRDGTREFNTGSGQGFFNPMNGRVPQKSADKSNKTPPNNDPRGAFSKTPPENPPPQPINLQALVTEITTAVQRDTFKFIQQTHRETMQTMKKDLEGSIGRLFQSMSLNNAPGRPNMSIPPPNAYPYGNAPNVGYSYPPNPEYELRYRTPGNENTAPGSGAHNRNNMNANGNANNAHVRNNQGANERNIAVPNDKVNMENWGIKYDGANMTFEQASGYTSKQVFDNFHKLLTGENMISWYWGYRQGNQNATYEDFKIALNQEWGSRETDIEIWRKMLARRQRPNETFDKFWEEMRTMVYRLKYIPDSADLIGLIRGNVLPEIELSLVADKTLSVPDFIKACRVADDIVKKSANVYGCKPFGFRKSVNEIEFEPEAVVDELKRSSRPVMSQNSSKVEENSQEAFKNCWNCNEEHRFRDCIYEIKGIFCFRCGRRGVIAPRCRCRENRQ